MMICHGDVIINHNNVTLIRVTDIETVFELKNRRVISLPGDWRKRIINALRAGAVVLYSTHYDLRS